MAKQKQKTKADVTKVIFVLDESGSMGRLKSETIDGFNNYLQELRDEEKEYVLDVISFNSNATRYIYADVPLNKCKNLTANDYKPAQWTPLYDAMLTAIRKGGDNEKTIVVVMTDGKNNINPGLLSDLIKLIQEKEAYGWGFVYLGAAADAWGEEKAFAGTTMALNSGYHEDNVRGRGQAFALASRVTKSYANKAKEDKTAFLIEK